MDQWLKSCELKHESSDENRKANTTTLNNIVNINSEQGLDANIEWDSACAEMTEFLNVMHFHKL